MNTNEFFPSDYQDGRAKFLEAADEAGAEITSYQNPLRGPDGGKLFTDVAWIGSTSAKHVFVSMSGTHGVEGFAGSGIQVGSLKQGRYAELPSDVAVMLIHAVTPFGFAWLRRTNEDGVDVCRNFLDFSKPLPRNEAFDSVARLLVPEEWTGSVREQADQAYLDFIVENGGPDKFKQIVARGQYDYWFAPFFGGNAPTWSNRTFRKIIRTHLAHAENVVAIDYHTGLGENGTGQLLGFEPIGADSTVRAERCWGDKFASTYADETVAYEVTGDIASVIQEELPTATVTSVCYEFGTADVLEVGTALRGDHWLHAHGDLSSPLAKEIKKNLRDAFYCDTDEWRDAIFKLGVCAEQEALAMLSNPDRG